MDLKSLFGDSGEEKRMKRQMSVPGIKPGPSNQESSVPSTKPIPGTNSPFPHSSLYAGSVC